MCNYISGSSIKSGRGVLLKTKDAGQGIVQLTSEKGQPKVVSVVFDNSSSMVKKDKKPGEKIAEEERYTTRWIEADYTVKALAAMMDVDDILRLYIMSGYRSEVKRLECQDLGKSELEKRSRKP